MNESDVTTHSWPMVLEAVTSGRSPGAAATAWAMGEIMSDGATGAQIAAFGIGLKMKGTTAEELAALADTMRSFAVPVRAEPGAIDIVGTGGDGAHTVNISTMASVVAAAAGVRVVKHGNRAASSKSGGADVLEALGVDIDLDPAGVEHCIAEAGIGFCFAARHHPALRFAGPARRQLGVPTVFNVLGPLTNPAGVEDGLVGCAFPEYLDPMAEVFARRGGSVLVVRGRDGLDEITVTGPTDVRIVAGGQVRRAVLDPGALGVDRAPLEALRGGDAVHNAEVARATWAGERGSVRDAVLMNAGAALAAASLSTGTVEPTELAGRVRAGMDRAAAAIDSGAATALFESWARASREAVGR